MGVAPVEYHENCLPTRELLSVLDLHKSTGKSVSRLTRFSLGIVRSSGGWKEETVRGAFTR